VSELRQILGDDIIKFIIIALTFAIFIRVLSGGRS
jgi:hypothetical protein